MGGPGSGRKKGSGGGKIKATAAQKKRANFLINKSIKQRNKGKSSMQIARENAQLLRYYVI